MSLGLARVFFPEPLPALRMSRSADVRAESAKFSGSACLQRWVAAEFLDFMNSLLTKILKVYVDLRRFYYADVSQR